MGTQIQKEYIKTVNCQKTSLDVIAKVYLASLSSLLKHRANMKDEYFTTKKCGRVDLKIMSPNSMPDSMQDRALRTNLLDMDRSILTRTWTPIGLSSPE